MTNFKRAVDRYRRAVTEMAFVDTLHPIDQERVRRRYKMAERIIMSYEPKAVRVSARDD